MCRFSRLQADYQQAEEEEEEAEVCVADKDGVSE